MARTKRTPRRAAKALTPVQRFNSLKTSALGAVGAILKQGAALRLKSRKLAVARAREARDAVATRADEARTRTVDAVTRFEKAFENRVSKTVSKLGVPTARDVRALSRQVAHLQQSVDRLRRPRARA
jgi:poly(hydroxyalkanoate) granule-associated protein